MDEPKHLHEPGGDFQCLHEFIPVARKKLSDHVWGYLVGAAESETVIGMTRLYVNEAMGKLDLWSRELLAACASGDELRTMLAAARRLTKYTPIDASHLRLEIGKAFVEKGKWEI